MPIVLSQKYDLNADRAISDKNEDRFGFSDISRPLAASVVSAAAQKGMVIAVEGKWGSGKSSLVQLMQQEIKQNFGNNISVINFAPWLIGQRSQYVIALTEALAKEIEKHADIAGRSATLDQKKARENATLLRTYGAHATGFLAQAAELGSLLHPAFKYVGKIFNIAKSYLEKSKSEPTIEEQKAEIEKILGEQNLRFVILLDDLDRLEPAEAVEVMRLIRSVADFPNVVYILCYDREVLSHAIEEGLRVKDGNSYLQKIVQVSFRVPRPEPFDLRHWLKDEIEQIFIQESTEDDNPSSFLKTHDQELSSAIDFFGGTLSTPRDVVAILNSLRFHFPPIKNEIYFPDLVFLQIVKITWPKLYEWIENYIGEWSVIATGDAILTAGETSKFQKELRELLDQDDTLANNQFYRLAKYIPGIEPDIGEDFCKVFEKPNDEKLREFDQLKRLGSPEFSRYYFAFSGLRLGFSSTEIENIIQLASRNTEGLKLRFKEMARESRPLNGTWFEYLIDRLTRSSHENWDDNVLCNVLITISDIMDEVQLSPYILRPYGKLNIATSASDFAYRLLNTLRDRNSDLHKQTYDRMVVEGQSIAWLVDSFIDDELLRHGYHGRGTTTEASWNLSTEEVEFGRIELLKRLQQTEERNQLYRSKLLASPLFRWRDFANGDLKPAQNWVKEFTETDEGFIHVMEGLRGWVNSSSTGISYPLKRSSVEPFTDWDGTLDRLKKISNDINITEDLRIRASKLLLDIDEDF